MGKKASFEIGDLNANTPHLLADLIELIALLGLDGRASYGPADIESILVAEKENFEGGKATAAVTEAWKHLSYRAGRFDRAYPFVIRAGRLVKRRLNSESRIYIFLLACSRLRSFNEKQRQQWATGFASLSAVAMKHLLPSWGETRIFDANSVDRKTYYGTDLRLALKTLGADIAPRAVDEGEIALLSSSGDYKIDLVSVCQFADGAHTHHVILGQCAARGEHWPEKRLEAHAISLSGVYTFNHPPANALLTPVLFRQPNGAWVDHTSVSGCLPIDRWRLVMLLRKETSLTPLVTAPWFLAFEAAFATVAAAQVAVAA